MVTGIVLLNFGEPAVPDEDRVRAYLERIFLTNAAVDPHGGDGARERARTLAERRAPTLVEEYTAIDGSPLNHQSVEQATALAGVAFHRVPVPHDDERFVTVLADLVEPIVAGIDPDVYNLRPCRCSETLDALCLNCPSEP